MASIDLHCLRSLFVILEVDREKRVSIDSRDMELCFFTHHVLNSWRDSHYISRLLTRVVSEFVVSLAFLEVFSYIGSTGGGL